jgi:uncharacterized protein YqeY
VSTPIEPALQDALRAALRACDRTTLSTIRSALARLANAEAVPVESLPPAGAVEGAAVGVGAADAPRRELTEPERRVLVEQEAAELADAAAHYRTAGRTTEADRADAGAALLRGLLESAGA